MNIARTRVLSYFRLWCRVWFPADDQRLEEAVLQRHNLLETCLRQQLLECREGHTVIPATPNDTGMHCRVPLVLNDVRGQVVAISVKLPEVEMMIRLPSAS